MTTINDLTVGESARVKDVAGDDVVGARILEMGMTPGTVISLRGMAPLGDPLELDVRGYRLSVRRSEAARVMVDRVSS